MSGANTGAGSSADTLKVVLLGEGCVGKTSILVRYVHDTFNDRHISTLQASFMNKKLNIDGKRVNLSIWDTAGQEKFHALGPIYYRGSNGGILVYDITDDKSFSKVKCWVKELKKILGSDICLAIAGNKTDLEDERVVSVEEAESYAASVGAQHFQISAKMNEGVEDLFLELTKSMISKMESTPSARTSTIDSRVFVVEDDPPVSGGCCSSFH